MENENKEEKIKIEDFKKIDIRVGRIVAVEKVPDTEKLLKLTVDLGEALHRTIVSGIALYFADYLSLVDKKCMFVANLEPRVIRGIESQGMVLAVSTEEGAFSLLEPNDTIPVGASAK